MGTENDTTDLNKHIKEYLCNYLTLSSPEYAILLNGKWGSGKTHFIEKFINEYEEENIKFIKISLFGLKNTESIDEEIFQNLHPLLGSKYAKIAGNVLKSALKLGVNLDWNQDGRNDGAVSFDLKTFNPLDFFSDKKKTGQEIVFVFDDLERTEINLKAALGYINYLIEQSKFKVIILANEEKLKSEEYLEFKEKVIGKTFEVRHSFDDVLTSFIDSKTSRSRDMLKANASVIKNSYERAGHNNLRQVSQALYDFDYFARDIEDSYLNHEDFVSVLINNFFAISIELKSANLTRKDLSSESVALLGMIGTKGEEKSKIEEIYEKHKIKNNPLFSGKDWVRILLDNSIQSEELNQLISDLSYFIKENDADRPSWVKIWYYTQLSDQDFSDNLKDVIEKFNNCEYDIPEHLIHVAALLVFFGKNSLCDISVEDINEKILTCINAKYKNLPSWKNELFERTMSHNRTGLGYMCDEDPDFKHIFSKIISENKIIYTREEEIKLKESLDRLLDSMRVMDKNFLSELLLEDLPPAPVFNKLNADKFINALKAMPNSNFQPLSQILRSRYSGNHIIDGKPSYSYLILELPFWKDVGSVLKVLTTNRNHDSRLNTFLLIQFNNFIVSDIVLKLETVKS